MLTVQHPSYGEVRTGKRVQIKVAIWDARPSQNAVPVGDFQPMWCPEITLPSEACQYLKS